MSAGDRRQPSGDGAEESAALREVRHAHSLAERSSSPIGLRLAALTLPSWRWMALGALLALLTVLANIGLLTLSNWFIAAMAVTGAAGGFMNYLTPSAGVRAFALARTGGRYLERLTTHEATFRILAEMRGWLFDHIEPIAPAGTQSLTSGDLLSRLGADIDSLDDYYIRFLVPILVAIVAVAVVVLFLLGYSLALALADLALLSGAGLLLPLLIRYLARSSGARLVETASRLRAAAIDGIQGLADLEVAGAAAAHRTLVNDLSREMAKAQSSLSHLAGLASGGTILLANGAILTGVLIAAPLVEAGKIQPVDLAMLAVFMFASFESVMPLPVAFELLAKVRTAARRIFAVVDAKRSVQEPLQHDTRPDALGAGVSSGGSSLDRPSSRPDSRPLSLRFDDVRFRYAADRPNALDGFALEIEPGERVAVVGSTGAGKSTLVNLLVRFWDYETGRILLDGRDLRGIAGEEARRLVAAVPQRPYLFHASIRENLLFARPAASERELREACRTAQLERWIDALPQGYDTEVGELGMRISAGEARRIAIARAFLVRAPLLALDEPTEGLDGPTARAMLSALFALSGESTILLITHRLAGLSDVDRVIVMERGRVVESGTHASLIRDGRLYHQLWELGEP